MSRSEALAHLAVFILGNLTGGFLTFPLLKRLIRRQSEKPLPPVVRNHRGSR